MKIVVAYLLVCCFAAIVPFVALHRGNVPNETTFRGWPTEFDGKPIVKLPLTQQESNFASGFPGRIGKFTDGSRIIIMRWLTKRTRKLHPASHCFKGIGYDVHPLPIHTDSRGVHWGSFEADKDGRHLVVYERIIDNLGNGWTDVSAWYWAALLNRTHGSWWALTVIESQ